MGVGVGPPGSAGAHLSMSGPTEVPRGAWRGGGRQGRVQLGAAGIPARLPVPDPSAALLLGGWRAGPVQPTTQEEHAHRDPRRDPHSPHTETSGHASLPATACPGIPSSRGHQRPGHGTRPSPSPSPPGTGRHQSCTSHSRAPHPPCCKVRGRSEEGPTELSQSQCPRQHPPNLLKEGPHSKRGVLSAGVLLHSPAVSPSPQMYLSRPHRGCPTAAGRPQPPGATHMRKGHQAGRGSERRLGLRAEAGTQSGGWLCSNSRRCQLGELRCGARGRPSPA